MIPLAMIAVLGLLAVPTGIVVCYRSRGIGPVYGTAVVVLGLTLLALAIILYWPAFSIQPP